MMAGEDETFEVTATVWLWRPARPEAAGWYFLTVEGQTAAEIRYAALGRTGGFGSVKVTATIGATQWQTSLFPQRETGGLLLPLKAEVRRREGIVAGDTVTVRLDV
jgi:hypothetical protein